jgi:hypothetical protein
METGRLQDAKNLVETLDLEGMLELNRYVISNIKHERAFIAQQIKDQLSVGQNVSFDNRGEEVKGTVSAIKRKFAHVETAANVWRVPISVLNIETSA